MQPNIWGTIIRFRDPEQRGPAWELLEKSDVLYEILHFGCTQVEPEGLDVLKKSGFEFDEMDYKSYLENTPEGEALREGYIKTLEARYGINNEKLEEMGGPRKLTYLMGKIFHS